MSQCAKRFTGASGTVTLMEDLGNALNQNPELIFMGGGNPAQIEEVETILAEHLVRISRSSRQFHKLIGEYQPPQGDPEFLEILAEYLNEQRGWSVSSHNIAVCNGGQSGFFTLFNMLASQDQHGRHRSILLPVVPDYLGYSDVGLHEQMFTGRKPIIETLDKTFFKYRVDFEGLSLNTDVAAICISRPANPSGNIVSDDELIQLEALCRQSNIPLVIDAAYGMPFPNITYVDHVLNWHPNIILMLSLSKLGLPGARTGLLIADEEMIRRFSRATASIALAPCNLGPVLMKSLIQSGDIHKLVDRHIRPFYRNKMQQTVDYLVKVFEGLPVKLHKPEGAFFLWLWFQNLPITSQQLYERLRDRGVLVLSGHHFFQALDDHQWPHRHQCLRISYCQPWERIKAGIDIMADEVRNLMTV